MKLAAIIAASVALGGATEAIAAPANAPVPCTNIPALEDASGDQRIGFAGRTTPAPAEDTQDIKSLFFTTKGTSQVLVNLHLANATDDAAAAPVGSAGLIYRMIYTTSDGVRRYIDASFSTVFGTTYSYGTLGTGGPTYEGAANGKIFRGADGVIQITVPGAKQGQPLSDVSFFAARDQGAVLAQSDRVPDGSEVTEYNGASCAV